MKLLIVLPRFPLPVEKGDQLRIYNQIKGLSKTFSITLFCTSDKVEEQYIKTLKQDVDDIKLFHIGWIERIISLFVALFSNLPFQVAYFKSKKLKKELEVKLNNGSFDRCYVQLIRSNVNIPDIVNTPIIFDFMDCFSLNFELRASQLKGNWSVLNLWESKRVKHYEQKILDRNWKYTIISKRDAIAIEGESNVIKVIPNGVHHSFLNQNEIPETYKYDIILTGNFSYIPNIEAAKYLVNNIVEPLCDKGVKLKVCLAGRNPSNEVKKLANAQIEVTGSVPELIPYLLSSKIFVAPLFTGAGLQNKVLESMALGIPTITTSLVNDSLEAIDGESVIIANTKNDFQQVIIKFIENPFKLQEIAASGKKFIALNYRWDKCNVELAEYIKKSH